MAFLKDFLWGVFSPLTAGQLVVRHPRTWPYVLLPFAVTCIAYYFLWADLYAPWQQGAGDVASNWVAGVFGVDSFENVKAGLRWLINALLIIFFWIVAIFTFSTFANLVTLPFNDFLAESIEPLCAPPLAQDYPSGWSAFFAAMWVDLRKTVIGAGILGVTFLFSWIPILNIIALVIACMSMSFQFSGFASTRRGLGARASLRILFKHWPAALGAGLAAMVLLSIPILKIFFFPILIVAGTMLFARIWHAEIAQRGTGQGKPPLQAT